MRYEHRQGCRKRGAGGGLPPSQFSAEQLTLSQPGGQIIPTTVLQAPRIFRPWYGPETYKYVMFLWQLFYLVHVESIRIKY